MISNGESYFKVGNILLATIIPTSDIYTLGFIGTTKPAGRLSIVTADLSPATCLTSWLSANRPSFDSLGWRVVSFLAI
jgi:hypothetical protein